MPRCAIFNFSVLFLENRLVTPIRSPNQRGFARNGSEKNRAKFSPHRAKSTPCLQIPATNEITFLICVKDPISGFRAIPSTDRQDFHQPAVYIGRTQPHAYNHLPARSFEVLMEPLSDQMSQIISTGFEGIVLFIVTSAGN